MKIISIVGARPNFIKIAPIMRVLSRRPSVRPVLVHTGQHYDDNMSKKFFKDLVIPQPDVCLGVGSGTHAAQTAKTMQRFERVLLKQKPDIVLVVGDVNSTLACALTACKLGIKVAHVEAGLRSNDKSMPEEINRLSTDHLSDFLFTTCEVANKNLAREGISKDKIFWVGNVMIDALLHSLRKIKKPAGIESGYAVATLHRASNVDDQRILERLLRALNRIAEQLPIVFPIHPRTQNRIKQFHLQKYCNGNIRCCQPMGYLDFLKSYSQARFVLTDSGGIQAEATALGIPCLTLSENTEWLITIKQGTNKLVGTEEGNVVKQALRLLKVRPNELKPLRYWDGKTSKRIVDILVRRKV